MHLLVLDDEAWVGRGVILPPKSLDNIPDVANVKLETWLYQGLDG